MSRAGFFGFFNSLIFFWYWRRVVYGTAGLPSSDLMLTRQDSAGLSLLRPTLVLGALGSEPERRPCLS